MRKINKILNEIAECAISEVYRFTDEYRSGLHPVDIDFDFRGKTIGRIEGEILKTVFQEEISESWEYPGESEILENEILEIDVIILGSSSNIYKNITEKVNDIIQLLMLINK